MVELVHIQPERNCRRFYSVRVEPDLFAPAVVIRQWGRLGSKGTYRVEPCESRSDADAAAERYVETKLRRGYVHAG